MRVFVSSTVYDLLDVRAEIADLLRSLGISPVLSDDKLSDFVVQFDANSIETCLINVESCNAVIVILDKRYGPSLGKVGFDDVSATHLEYRHAVEHNKPIHFYVRDRLAADYSVWTKNGRKSGDKLTWINEKDKALFALLDEHGTLKSDATRSNWYATFTNSTDLKAALRIHFERRIRPERLVEAIYENRFPLFTVDLEVDIGIIDNVDSLKGKATITNVGGATAFNFSTFWEDKEKDASELAIIAPGQSGTMTFLYGLDASAPHVTSCLIVQYETPIGVAVADRYEIRAGLRPGPQPMIRKMARLIERRFSHGDKVLLQIDGTE